MKKFYRSLLALALLLLPMVVLAQATTTELENPLGDVSTPVVIFTRITGALALFTGVLALLFTIIGGYIILTAAGNSERFAHGRRTVVYSILGLVVTVSSYLILSTTINVLTGAATGGGQLPPFKTEPTLVDPLGITSLLPEGTLTAVFYGHRIIGFLLGLLGAAVVVMYVYGGLKWMLSAGSEEKVTEAKKILTYATVGMVVVLSSYVLIRFIYSPFITLLQNG